MGVVILPETVYTDPGHFRARKLLEKDRKASHGDRAFECSENSMTDLVPRFKKSSSLIHLRSTGSRQETNPSHRQATTRHRRCLPRRDQRAPITTSRGTSGCTSGSDQGRQREESNGGKQEEDGEGQERGWGSEGTDRSHSEQAGSQGSAQQGDGQKSVIRWWWRLMGAMDRKHVCAGMRDTLI